MLYNPASGRGRGARRIGAIREAFARHGFTDVRGTERVGDEGRLVTEAIDDGVETIVVAGGDGTFSKCATTLARAGSPARMAILAAGTGNDFAKNLGVDPRDPARLARLIADGAPERLVDVMRVDDHWFLNVIGFGFDVAVLDASNRTGWLRGPAVYVAHAVRQLFSFEGVRFSVDGEPPRARLLAAISNGRSFGGTFTIAPDARVDDGLLDAVLVDDVAPLARVPLLAGVLRGTHLQSPHCTHRRAARFTLTFDTTPWMDADGELVQAAGREVEVAVVPRALRLVDV